MVFYMFRSRGHARTPIDPLTRYQATANRSAARGGTYARRPYSRPGRPTRVRSGFGPRFAKGVLIVIAVLAIALVAFVFTSGRGKFRLSSLIGGTAAKLIGISDPIAGQTSGRTNFLVYGMTKDGLRTDSIMLISYYWKQKKLVTLNIPRDLYVYDGYENAKMGEVYAYALARQPRNAQYPDQYVAQVISKEYGIPINYWVQFNMQGEVDFINAIGGINIDAPDSFTDCQYPTWDYSGYIRPCPHFNAGPQHMNGDTALIYSRSRHSLDNNEGTDFARSKRQQLVIQAVMTNLKSQGVIGNLAQVSKYLNILGNNLTTNMSTEQMITFGTDIKSLSPTADYVKGSWETGNGFLCDSTSSAGAYVTLYGTTGSCGIGAGGYKNSKYRQLAIYYVQNMLSSAPQSPTTFVTNGFEALGDLPKPSPSAQPAGH
jgi:LCP family protein required for cell wall assembly